MKKTKIPKALREQVWLTWCGHVFDHKCLVEWCSNTITPFIYEVGHNIPESRAVRPRSTTSGPYAARATRAWATTTRSTSLVRCPKGSQFFECFRFRKSPA